MPALMRAPTRVYPLLEGDLSVYSQHRAQDLDAAFGVAQRLNPKRPFLFVSRVLGRHVPVSPRVMRSTYNTLASHIPNNLPTPIVCMGMAETAVGLGAGVFESLRERYPDSLYVTSSRVDVDAPRLAQFSEDHSHAMTHWIYHPQDPLLQDRLARAKTIVLIDDEATTGNTFLHALEALRPHTQVTHVVTVTLTDWSSNAVAKRCDLPVTSVSLWQGSYDWESHEAKPIIQQRAGSNDASFSKPSLFTSKSCQWGRLGMDAPPRDFGRHIETFKGERICVLGTNEFVYEPFLLAERLEREGAHVRFSATTQSPILPNPTGIIRSALSLPDPYGSNTPHYAYNLISPRAPLQVDRIIIGTEIPDASFDTLVSRLTRCGAAVEVVSHE